VKGIIFAIQHYAVHDGPGIRTLVFMKGCPLHCAWCCNPESQSGIPQLRYISFRCKYCLRCAEICPKGAITPGNQMINPDFSLCRICADKPCTDTCPYEALLITGQEITNDDLMDRISRDIRFYRNSGGGVTFSGGEPFQQSGFLMSLLRKCNYTGIHTAIETCGFASRTALIEAIPLTNLFLFDLKVINPDLHLRYTGQPVGPILENLALLADRHPEVIIRFPVIPGITDSDDNIRDIARVMHQNGLSRIHLEPYHTLGVDKYQEHGMRYTLPEIAPVEAERLEEISTFFRNNQIVSMLV